MKPSRASIWVEVVLALSLITIITIVLNAGVFWLILKRGEEERRTDLAVALIDGMAAQLEVAARSSEGVGGLRPAEVLEAYTDSSIAFDELFIITANNRPVCVAAGSAPEVLDAGLRVALFGRKSDARVQGSVWGNRSVQVTAPVTVRGVSSAALRATLPLAAPSVYGSPSGFTLAYTTSTGVLIAVFGFSLFRRRLIRPIAAVREGTRRIADGEFGHQVEVDAAREFQALCDALNTMSTDLEQFRGRAAEQVEDLRQANIELQETQSALVRSERLAGVGRLAAGLAHEVGNPLSAVLGYLEFLEQSPGDPDLQSDLLGRSRLELERIHRIIRALLDDARKDSSGVEVLQAAEVAREAIELVRHVPRMRGVAFRLEMAEGDLETDVRIERDKLHQVLINLLLNAGDASAQQQARSAVLEIRSLEDQVSIRCIDNGPGFSEQAFERATEPFFTTKEPGKGTGLGLAISARVIEAAGGTLGLSNAPEGGACVDLLLPRVSAS